MTIPSANYVCQHSTFDPEQESERANEKFTAFETLLPELIKLVFDRMGHPTQILFAWTCKKYCGLFFKPDQDQFDRHKLIDKCAKLGRHQLVAECVKEYGLPVDIVTICKAARHGHSYDELWEPFLRNPRRRNDFNFFRSMSYLKAADWAAHGGHLNLSSSLADYSRRLLGNSPSADEQYANGLVNLLPDRLIYQLAKGGQVDLAEYVYANLTDHQRISLPTKRRFIGLVLEGAVYSGNLSLVNWCIAQDSDVLEEVAPWDKRGKKWSLLDVLMERAMTYGSMEWCILAKEMGWQPKQELGKCTLVFLKTECHRCKRFISTSNHLACLQYLDATYADPYMARYVNLHYSSLPLMADLDGLTWLHRQGYMPQLQQNFEFYCGASYGQLTARRRSKTSIDQIVDWFIDKGAKINHSALWDAVMYYQTDLLNVLWERNPKALFNNVLRNLIEEEVAFCKDNTDEPPILAYDECKKQRFCPLKRAKALLRTVKWLLDKGNKLDGLQQQCDELALAMLKMDRRAARIFFTDPVIQMHISEEVRNMIRAATLESERKEA